MNALKFYLLVVVLISVPIALFERWMIAHYKVGWNAPLPADKWFMWKPLAKGLPFVGDVLLTRYHFATFFFGGLTLSAIFGHLLKGYAAQPPSGFVAWLLFAVAGMMGNMALEDFLFFVFSTIFGSPYPHALSRLFRGEAVWHKKQTKIFGYFYLPTFYIVFPPIIAGLVFFATRL